MCTRAGVCMWVCVHARVGMSVWARAYKWTREIYAIPYGFTDVRIRVRTIGRTPTEIHAVPYAFTDVSVSLSVQMDASQ